MKKRNGAPEIPFSVMTRSGLDSGSRLSYTRTINQGVLCTARVSVGATANARYTTVLGLATGNLLHAGIPLDVDWAHARVVG
jgi:hypothetical protein